MKFPVFVLICIIPFACAHNEKKVEAKNIDKNSSEQNPKSNLQINTFDEIDHSGVILIPLQMRVGNPENESIIELASSASYERTDHSSYWNILFYNTKSNIYHLLTDKKVKILRYHYDFNESTNKSENVPFIFYEIKIDDYNKDNFLNYNDPTYLYISDKFGKNFRQISKSNYHLQDWKYINSTSKVVFTLIRDSDNNLEFDKEDEISIFDYSLKENQGGVDIINDSLKNVLRTLYDRDWKVIIK